VDVSYPDKGNPACLDRTLSLARESSTQPQLVFVNLVDTDMVYGHRRDPKGYHDSVAETDKALEELLSHLGKEDLLFITADHGCDPTYRGSDHTREHVPLLVYRQGRPGSNLGIRESFADVAQTLAAFFGAGPYPKTGRPRGEAFQV